MTDDPQVILSKSGKAMYVLNTSIRLGITITFLMFKQL